MTSFRISLWRLADFVIVSSFVLLIVVALGVIALPCETMKVVLTNESDTWARVRVGVRNPTRDLWSGDLAAGEARTLSLAAIPNSQFTDVFVQFPELGADEITWSEEPLVGGYPFGIAIHRFRFAPGRIHSKTVYDWWGNRFDSRILRDLSALFEFLFVALRCVDCEIAAWLRQ